MENSFYNVLGIGGHFVRRVSQVSYENAEDTPASELLLATKILDELLREFVDKTPCFLRKNWEFQQPFPCHDNGLRS